jgi:hypothetical protein
MVSNKGVKHFRPYDLVIVGLDCEVTDENRVLADPDRIDLLVTREAAQDVLDRGIDTPIKVRKRGNVHEVVYGRQRVRTARVAWDVEEKDGIPEAERTLVPATFAPDGLTDLDLRRMVVGENLARQNEDVVSAARKAQSLLDLGDKKGTVAELCRVSEKTLRDWLKLVKLHPDVQEMVRRGEVGFVNAVDLMAGVSKEKQPAEMRRLITEGKATGLAAEAAVAAKNGHGKADEDDADGEVDEKPALPGKGATKRFAAYFAAEVHKDDVYTRKQVSNLLDHVLYGAPLRGPIREHWKRANPVASRG